MTESRYPSLEQANGDHRDSFSSRFANLKHGYDSGAQYDSGSQPAASAGPTSAPPNGSPASGSGSGANGYDPAATQYSFSSPDSPPGPGTLGTDSGATRAVSPADFEGYDLSKIGGTSTYGGSTPGSPSSSPPSSSPPSSSPPSYGSRHSGTSGYTGSMTGYDPANYPPPSSSYGQSHPDGSTYRVGRDGTVKKVGVDTQTGMPPTSGLGPSPTRTSLSSTAHRGPRRARLQLKHIDPWSTMKFSLVMSVALFVVWMIAVGLLYGVLGGMGVWDKINNLYDQVAGGNLITASFVLGSAAVIGAINIVLFTALATVGAFVYNLCSDLVGGIELTLSERD
jgi:Transmembrane domain of unknown function (DUF3566)